MLYAADRSGPLLGRHRYKMEKHTHAGAQHVREDVEVELGETDPLRPQGRTQRKDGFSSSSPDPDVHATSRRGAQRWP